eukprot:12910994-Prorocentrum_lima.AAC.1
MASSCDKRNANHQSAPKDLAELQGQPLGVDSDGARHQSVAADQPQQGPGGGVSEFSSPTDRLGCVR